MEPKPAKIGATNMPTYSMVGTLKFHTKVNEIQQTQLGKIEESFQNIEKKNLINMNIKALLQTDIDQLEFYDAGKDKIYYFKDMYTVKELKGIGSFGAVLDVIDKKLMKRIALKIIAHNSKFSNHKAIIREEARVMQRINHENIVKCYYFKEFLSYSLIAMSRCKISLRDYETARRKQNNLITEDEIATIMKSVCQGIKHMHDRQTIHRDLKPANIMLKSKSDLSKVQIIDLGLALNLNVQQPCYENWGGTFAFMAPEQTDKLNYKYGKPVDIWALGIIMYRLLEGVHPYATPEME